MKTPSLFILTGILLLSTAFPLQAGPNLKKPQGPNQPPPHDFNPEEELKNCERMASECKMRASKIREEAAREKGPLSEKKLRFAEIEEKMGNLFQMKSKAIRAKNKQQFDQACRAQGELMAQRQKMMGKEGSSDEPPSNSQQPPPHPGENQPPENFSDSHPSGHPGNPSSTPPAPQSPAEPGNKEWLDYKIKD